MEIEISKVANTVVSMSGFIGVDYKTIWDKYTHDLITSQFSWQEVEEYINNKINLGRSIENEYV